MVAHGGDEQISQRQRDGKPAKGHDDDDDGSSASSQKNDRKR